MSFDCLNSISVDQLTLGTWLTMSFQDVNVLYVVFWTKYCFRFNCLYWVYYKVCEKWRVSINKFAWHWCLCTVQKSLVSKTIYCDSQFVLNVSTCLPCCNFEAHNDVGRMYFHFDELVGSFKQLSCQNNDWSGTITNFCIL